GGTYAVDGPIALTATTSLFGGYDPADWSHDPDAQLTTLAATGSMSAVVIVEAGASNAIAVADVHIDATLMSGELVGIRNEDGSPRIARGWSSAYGAGAADLTGSHSVAGHPTIRDNVISLVEGAGVTGIRLDRDNPVVFNNVVDVQGASHDFGITF